MLNLTPHQKTEIIEKACALGIELSGGIGDHLEELSRIIPWIKANNVELDLCSTKTRVQQFQGLTSEHKWNHVRKASVTSKVFLAALGDDIPRPQSYIELTDPKPRSKKSILFCLTAVGNSDNLSRWMRSLHFSDALKLIKKAKASQNKITDISDWKNWETKILDSMEVYRYNPTTGSIRDLAELIIQHEHIITIDTALAHLCAAIGKKCIVMLPKYYDERWEELMKDETSYSKCCKIFMQETYGTWRNDANRVLDEIEL